MLFFSIWPFTRFRIKTCIYRDWQFHFFFAVFKFSKISRGLNFAVGYFSKKKWVVYFRGLPQTCEYKSTRKLVSAKINPLKVSNKLQIQEAYVN